MVLDEPVEFVGIGVVVVEFLPAPLVETGVGVGPNVWEVLNEHVEVADPDVWVVV